MSVASISKTARRWQRQDEGRGSERAPVVLSRVGFAAVVRFAAVTEPYYPRKVITPAVYRLVRVTPIPSEEEQREAAKKRRNDRKTQGAR